MKKYKIDESKCAGCGACVEICPHGAIKIREDGKAIIDQKKCRGCDLCKDICPLGAIKEAILIEK